MELTRQDTQKAKGVAILGMVMLHLFCRIDNLPYKPIIWFGNVPFIYYLGLFGDFCVPIYCFCSGYAHYLLSQNHGAAYPKTIPPRILKFLINYWIVVVLFSFIGLVSGNKNEIPVDPETFLNNLLVVKMSYNGAWWFVTTYILLSFSSVWLTTFINKVPSFITLIISFSLYFVSYLFRFKFIFIIDNPTLDWLWQQTILFGTSQIGFIWGMMFRKFEWIHKLRTYFQIEHTTYAKVIRSFLIIILPILAFLLHCVIQSLFVAPFTAMSVLTSLFLMKQPLWLESFLLMLGKHSTNIWLTHMFFYLVLFNDFVFIGTYPLIILVFMMLLCIITSKVILWIYEKTLNICFRNRS